MAFFCFSCRNECTSEYKCVTCANIFCIARTCIEPLTEDDDGGIETVRCLACKAKEELPAVREDDEEVVVVLDDVPGM